MRRVLVFTTVFPSPLYPVRGLFVYERVRHAARLAAVRVVAPVPWFRRMPGGADAAAEPCVGLTVHRPSFYYVPGVLKFLDGLFLFLSALAAVRRLRRTFDFDLIDAHFGYPDGVAAVLLGRWFHRPVTLTLRGTEIDLVRYRLRSMAMGWAVRHAERVIAVSHQLGELAVALGAQPDRVTVIPNGVDTARFAPMSAEEARRSLGLPPQGKLVVSVGHLVPLKRFDLVLRAWPDVARKYPDARFAIVGGRSAGTGNYPSQLERLASQLGIDHRVVFAGAADPDTVARWLNAADVFVLTSRREGCPNVVWEALACGTPVVASKVGEVERMVPTFAGILLDDPNNVDDLAAKIVDGLSRPWDRARIRSHAAAHTWEAVAELVEAQWNLASDPGVRTPAKGS